MECVKQKKNKKKDKTESNWNIQMHACIWHSDRHWDWTQKVSNDYIYIYMLSPKISVSNP